MQDNIVFNDLTRSVPEDKQAQLKGSCDQALADWLALFPSPHTLDVKLSVLNSLESGHLAVARTSSWKTIADRGPGEGGGMLVMPHAAYKAITGNDKSSKKPDIDVWISRSTVESLSFDGTFDAERRYDATTLFRHELAHALFMTNSPSPEKGNITGWDSRIAPVDGVSKFIGANVEALIPGGVPVVGGSHVEEATALQHGSSLGPKLPENTVLELSPLDEALLSDSGLPTRLNDRMTFGDWIGGWDTDKGTRTIDMGEGLDVVVIQAKVEKYSISYEDGVITLLSNQKYYPSGREDLKFNPELKLLNTERVQFNDALCAFDIDGNAGSAYRLCKAIYGDDPPDNALGELLNALDSGVTPYALVNKFIETGDFTVRFGPSIHYDDLIASCYKNFFGYRERDDEGYEYWKTAMDNGLGVEFLVLSFVNSLENEKNTAKEIGSHVEIPLEFYI